VALYAIVILATGRGERPAGRRRSVIEALSG